MRRIYVSVVSTSRPFVCLQGKEVAGMRSEMKELRAALAEQLEALGDGVTTSMNDQVAALVAAVAAERARESTASMQRHLAARAAGAASPSAHTSLTEDEVLELDLLQLENDELRCAAALPLLPPR
jgi:hypothetical protein